MRTAFTRIPAPEMEDRDQARNVLGPNFQISQNLNSTFSVIPEHWRLIVSLIVS